MNTESITTEHTPRPFGYWLRTVDRLLVREFESAFEAEGITRRDWRVLSVLAGDHTSPELLARIQRGGGKKVRPLVERGWVTESAGAWAITDEGRAAQARLAEIVAGIRGKIAGAVSSEDFATTQATLEAVARELGWDPAERMPRGRGHRRGFGPRGVGRRGFGVSGHDGNFGRPHERRCETDRAGHREHGHGHPHHPHGRRGAEQAFERGFAAGFTAAGDRA